MYDTVAFYLYKLYYNCNNFHDVDSMYFSHFPISVSPSLPPDASGPGEEARSEEWIKRTALKHIRYLRGRKKKDNYVLSCRICNDGKVFTAAATLLYHYR